VQDQRGRVDRGYAVVPHCCAVVEHHATGTSRHWFHDDNHFVGKLTLLSREPLSGRRDHAHQFPKKPAHRLRHRPVAKVLPEDGGQPTALIVGRRLFGYG